MGVGDEILFVGSLDARTINDAFFNIEYQEYLSKVFNRDHSSIFRRYGLHNHRIITPEDDRVLKFSLGDFGALEEEDIRRLPYFCVTGLRDDFPVIHSGKRGNPLHAVVSRRGIRPENRWDSCVQIFRLRAYRNHKEFF